MRNLRQIKKIVRYQKRSEKEQHKDKYYETEPNIACMAPKTGIYYSLKEGADPEDLFSRIQNVTDVPISYVDKPRNWISLPKCIKIMDECCYALGIDSEERKSETYRNMGRSLLELRCINPNMFFIPFIIGGPRDMMDFNILFSKQFEQYMSKSMKDDGDEIRIIARYEHGLEKITRCEWEDGLYEMIPTFYGYKHFEVNHERCVKRGDDSCEYVIKTDLEKDKDASFISRFRGALSRMTPNIFSLLKDAFTDYNRSLQKSLDQTREALEESRDKSSILETYTRKSLVDRVNEGDDPRRDEMKREKVDILFSDIREFTKITQDMDLDTVSQFLNEYFRYMNDPIIKNHGEIDKLIGDSIMAAFRGKRGVSSSDHAVDAAIDMRRKLSEYNSTMRHPWMPLNNGIGINHGEVMVGNIGSADKLDNTIIGSVVNVASRLEALTKYYHSGILISQESLDRVDKEHDIRFMDEIEVKGYSSNSIRIYEVYDQERDDVKELKKKFADSYLEAFEAYTRKDFGHAERIYESLKKEVGEHNWIEGLPKDPALEFYVARTIKMKEMDERGLLDDWDGVYRFKEK